MKNNRIIRADGKILNTGGCKCSAPRPDIPVYSSTRYKSSQLPKKVDLRPFMTAIEDQGQINSCTANATVGALEYLVKTKYNAEVDFSRLFVYYNARAAQGDTKRDDGSCICDAVDSLKKIGVCTEDIWPNDKKLVLNKPSRECYKAAAELLISGCKRVKVSLDDYKLALAEGNPIIFGMSLFNSFDRQRRKGFVPMPSRDDTARGSHGSHAMLCVGYSDVDQVFIVRNSWGTKWGDHGYCYIPYNYLANPKYNGGDSWIIDIPDNTEAEAEEVEEAWDNEEAWSDDDESVLTDLNDEFANMDDEQWQAFNDAMGKYDLPYRLGALFAVACIMDDELSDEEAAAAVEHLQNVLKIFNYKMDASRVFHRCIKLAQKDNFLEESVEILGEYLSPGALATIAKNMYEIAGADGLDPEEEEFIDALVGAWLDTDEELEYNEEYDDDEAYDDDDEDYDDEDEEDIYFLDDDEGWDDDDDDEDECDCDDDDDDDEDYDDDDDEDYDDDDDEDYDEDDDEDYDDDDDEDYDEDDDEDYDEDDDEDYDEDDDEDYDEDDDEDYDEDDDEEDYDEDDDDEDY